MATILYRDGNAERIEPEYVADSLTNGYFVTREESLGEAPLEDEGELGDADPQIDESNATSD